MAMKEESEKMQTQEQEEREKKKDHGRSRRMRRKKRRMRSLKGYLSKERRGKSVQRIWYERQGRRKEYQNNYHLERKRRV